MNNVKVKTPTVIVHGSRHHCFITSPSQHQLVQRYMPPTKHPGWRGSQALQCLGEEKRYKI